MLYLGIDTSNYTTSAALYNSDDGSIVQKKMLLPVKQGELGLRQSDAVFHHTKQLPLILEELLGDVSGSIGRVAVSTRPRMQEGSYMPCFLVGEGFARAIAAAEKAPVYYTSHQVGHILAALYSSGKTELVNSEFIAFHVSGGTTDCLYVKPSDKEIIEVEEISSSLDLKAGQAVDRVGVMLGLSFPCGKELEKLALKSEKKYKIKPVLKDGGCSLSGIENKCKKMLDDGEAHEDIAMFCLESVCAAVDGMTERAIAAKGQLPVVFAGGVMSDVIIRKKLESRFDAYFAEPEFSCDNAAGIAFFAKLIGDRNG